ncbi:MAG: hypothetical protein WKG07_20700 [Hymenobacter sp.]
MHVLLISRLVLFDAGLVLLLPGLSAVSAAGHARVWCSCCWPSAWA